MKVYVINLKEAEERRKSITAQLNKLSLDFEIFEAIHGASLSKEELESKVDLAEVAKYPHWLTPGMLGASLSHMGVYRKILDSSEDWHLVFEDDVIVDRTVINMMRIVTENGHLFENHIILLYAVAYPKKLSLQKDVIHSNGTTRIHKVADPIMGGAGGYMLHKKTAALLIKNNPIIKVAPDSWNFFLEQGCYVQIDCAYPFCARPGFFESTIGYINKDSLLYNMKHLVEKLKIPVLHQLLKMNRKRIWNRMSKVEFVA